MSKRWLGLDPGLARIGWAVLEIDEPLPAQLLDYGTIETSKRCPTPERLLEIEKDISEILQEFQPQAVAIEMPFLVAKLKPQGGLYKRLGY